MKETVSAIAGRCGIPEAVVEQVFSHLASYAYSNAARGFTLPGFGEFKVVESEPQKGINPFTGEEVLFKGKPEVVFELNVSAREAFLAGARGVQDVTDSEDLTPLDRLPEVRLTIGEEELSRAEITRVFDEGPSKLGGEPDWIQADETPDCVGCGRVMQLYAQIDSAFATEFYIGDVGRLYVFRCPSCWHAQAVMQCS